MATETGQWFIKEKNTLVDVTHVRGANRTFYDTVADVYERVDGRRSAELTGWLDEIMRDLSARTDGHSLLDIGCGTGLVMRTAKKHFSRVYGMDISSKILASAQQEAHGAICSDAEFLPFRSESMDVVSCFATLHHCFDPLPVLSEAFRVLKKGGLLYTDHDIDASFMRLFYLPMKLYRFMADPGGRYLREKLELTRDLYELSEFHSGGIDGRGLARKLKECGFAEVKETYHWLGLSRTINLIMELRGSSRSFPRGMAPLFSVVARKKLHETM